MNPQRLPSRLTGRTSRVSYEGSAGRRGALAARGKTVVDARSTPDDAPLRRRDHRRCGRRSSAPHSPCWSCRRVAATVGVVGCALGPEPLREDSANCVAGRAAGRPSWLYAPSGRTREPSSRDACHIHSVPAPGTQRERVARRPQGSPSGRRCAAAASRCLRANSPPGYALNAGCCRRTSTSPSPRRSRPPDSRRHDHDVWRSRNDPAAGGANGASHGSSGRRRGATRRMPQSPCGTAHLSTPLR
jgi:hypothetical protein